MCRILYHARGLFLNYKKKQETFENTFDGNALWHVKEYWYVFIQVGEKFYEYEDLYFDGHTAQTLTLLWIRFGKSYGYESKPLKDWGIFNFWR